MAHKILFVEDSDEVRAGVARMLARRFDVRAARSAEEAVLAFDREGPFPVVLSDYGLPGMDGIELLREVHRHAPETVGVLLTGVADLDLAVSAVHESGVFRFLTKPCGFESMVQAIDEALGHHQELVEAGDAAEEASFELDSLVSFHESLEERMATQNHALARLHSFSVDVCSANSLQEVVDLAARAASSALSRAVHVQVWDDGDGATVEASAGSEMTAKLHMHPLTTREGQIGEIIVDLGGPRGTKLTEVDLALLSSIASSTAVTAHHEFRRRERDRAQHATILALARLAEQRDNETGKHLQRLAAYCRVTANALREDGKHAAVLTKSWIRDLELSSALHDIGKVGIPDSILLKPAKLTPGEWEIMKSHASIGEATLESVIAEFGPTRFLVMGRDIAGGHHEKWDGSGYPRGSRGERIPLAARILALVDVYDALTSERPYKKAWPHAEAIAWIRERGGSHFDPELAACFVSREAEIDRIRARLADEPTTQGVPVG
ncbi:MAG: response regulator [Planctomycetota bacterium]|nr:response regulator [Planctomycetota bacterium]